MTNPINFKEEVKESNDQKIHQDFPNVTDGVPDKSDRGRDQTKDQRHVSSAEKQEGQEDSPSQMPTAGKAVSEGRSGADTVGNP